jgi:hypothetical protein
LVYTLPPLLWPLTNNPRKKRVRMLRFPRFFDTVHLLSLDGDGSFFGPIVGRKLFEPSGNKTTSCGRMRCPDRHTPLCVANQIKSWGDRQVDRIKLAAAFTSRGAPWRPGAALASRGAGDALRGAGKLCERRDRDWLRSRVHSGGPSSLGPRPNRAPKAAIDSSSYGAHADMLGARFGVRAAEDGHLTLLRAHGAVGHVGCCCCHPPNACKCHRGLQRPCIERGPCADCLTGPCFD